MRGDSVTELGDPLVRGALRPEVRRRVSASARSERRPELGIGLQETAGVGERSGVAGRHTMPAPARRDQVGRLATRGEQQRPPGGHRLEHLRRQRALEDLEITQ